MLQSSINARKGRYISFCFHKWAIFDEHKNFNKITEIGTDLNGKDCEYEEKLSQVLTIQKKLINIVKVVKKLQKTVFV
jgi:hypothetical protein